jgi:hypothetical protein
LINALELEELKETPIRELSSPVEIMLLNEPIVSISAMCMR